jgi:hypothetical protein
MNSGEQLIMTEGDVFWFRHFNRTLHRHSVTVAL